MSNLRSRTSVNNGHCTTCCNQRVADVALSHAQTSFSTGGRTFPLCWDRKYSHANDGVPNLFVQQTVSNNISTKPQLTPREKVGDDLSCGPDPEQSVAIRKGLFHGVNHWRTPVACLAHSCQPAPRSARSPLALAPPLVTCRRTIAANVDKRWLCRGA